MSLSVEIWILDRVLLRLVLKELVEKVFDGVVEILIGMLAETVLTEAVQMIAQIFLYRISICSAF